jgi:hypothetical protein
MLGFPDISLGRTKAVSDLKNGVSVVVALNRDTVKVEDKLEDERLPRLPKILLSISGFAPPNRCGVQNLSVGTPRQRM